MITVEGSREATELVLEFVNTFRKKPITLQGFKNQRAKEAKGNCASYESVTGGLVPFKKSVQVGRLSGTISPDEMQKLIDGNV